MYLNQKKVNNLSFVFDPISIYLDQAKVNNDRLDLSLYAWIRKR